MTTCGYCRANVDKSKETHVHDPKVCSECKREVPASRFPLWRSSADGHRHQCEDCVRAEREVKKVERAASHERSRKARNEWFRENGYVWMMRTPDGRFLTPRDAERELEQKEWDARHDDWEEP